MTAKAFRLLWIAVLAVAVAYVSLAQPPEPSPTPAPAPTFEQRLAARAAENRHAVTFQNGAFSGAGWDLLLAEGRKSRFFNLASEMAAAEGSQSFHLLVAGGAGTQHAVFNPMTLLYEPAPVDLVAEEGLGAIAGQALPEGYTLIDLRPLRPLLSAARTKTADPELMRIVHGFDAVLILTGSHPSKMLP